MYEKNETLFRFRTDPLLDFQRQQLALNGEINIDMVAPIVDGEDFQTVARAVAGAGFLPLSEGGVEDLCSKHMGEFLIPVADPVAPVTWPTIAVPAQEELLSLHTDEEREHTLELLRAWRALVDGAASGRCELHGWIGGIRVPHPMMPSVMTTRWP